MTVIPSAYRWLLTLDPLPRVISEGLKLYGTIEKPGPGNNRQIMDWAEEVGVAAIGYRYTGDDVPWCGLYAAVVAKRAGESVPQGPLWAMNWASFGDPIARRDGLSPDKPLHFNGGIRKASLGDVLVFRRPGGGHVGFYIGEDDKYYCVLGGNQSDAVSFAWIAKARCVAIRRPAYTNPPASVRPFILNRSGAPVSENEA